jgi:PKD repeat protein
MKKTLLKSLLIALLIVSGSSRAFAQCANDNILAAGNLTPPGVGLSTTQTYNTGQYVLANVISGANYTVSTCSNSSFDSQITVYDNATGTFMAYNDDFCGVLSSTSFTPTFCGQVRILLDQYFCSPSNTALDVTMTMNTAGTGQPTLTSAPDVQACNGNVATIGIANNGNGGTPPYAFQWAPVAGLGSPTMTQSTLTVTATQPYNLTLTDANGCKAYDTVLVSVLPAPTINLGSDTTICGGPLTLNAGNVGSTYLWSTGQGTQTIAAPSSGTYSVAVQNPSGCIASDAINIIINPNPTVSIGPDTSTCGNSVTLDAGSGFTTYAWTTGDNTQTSNVTATGLVSVMVTDANGCSATDTAQVTLSPAPVVNLGPDITQCGGTATLDAGNLGSIYFWSNNSSSQTTTVSTSGTYSVQVISPAGCTGSDAINVTINNQPVVDLGPDTSICGNSIVLDAGTHAGATFLWNTSAATQSINAGAGTYFVHVTDPSGCSDADTIVVSTNAAPTVSAGTNQTLCVGQSTTLVATGAVYYVWSTGATTTTITVSPTINTNYYVTGYNASGCTGTATVSVTMLPNSNAQFTSSLSGATEFFTNQSTNAVSYSWNFGDGSPADNSANPYHTYSANGTYTVTLTATGPCGADTYTMVVTISQVGLQDVDLSNTLSLFPNPNDGNFTLSFEFVKEKDVTIQVLDVSGRIVFEDQENGILTYDKQIGLESEESGMYFVRILTTEGVVTQKIMIQK